MLQGIASDGRRFAPARDIVQLFPRVIGFHSAARLASKRWSPAVKAYAKFSNLETKDLAAAEIALGKFVALSAKVGLDDFETVFVQSGLHELPPAVLMTLMAIIGEVTCGVFFNTVRAATIAHSSIPGAEHLNAVAERAAHSLTNYGSERVHERRTTEVTAEALPSILDNDPTKE